MLSIISHYHFNIEIITELGRRKVRKMKYNDFYSILLRSSVKKVIVKSQKRNEMIVLDIFTHTGVEILFSSSTKNTRSKLYGVLFSVSLTIAFLLFDKQ